MTGFHAPAPVLPITSKEIKKQKNRRPAENDVIDDMDEFRRTLEEMTGAASGG